MKRDGKDQTKHYSSLITLAVTDIQSILESSRPIISQKTTVAQAEVDRLSRF